MKVWHGWLTHGLQVKERTGVEPSSCGWSAQGVDARVLPRGLGGGLR